ncbi:hypothetical protein RhiJN_06030 [Ceratobasidium sp. AG-Ba]|nr:hypothetical protein RhiJN_06030 [Ceratobasidium sp. AG-Ba]
MTTISGTNLTFFERSHKLDTEKEAGRIFRMTSPSLKKLQHVDIATDLQQILSWLSEEDPKHRLQISGIERRDLEALRKEIQREGRKIRYEWDSDCSVVIFRMPSAVHEAGGIWFGSRAKTITKAVAHAARCGRPEVASGASTTIQVPPRHREPDGQMYLKLHFDGHKVLDLSPARIVLETSYTQDDEEAVLKLAQYLCAPDSQIHAGVHISMSKSVTLVEDFHASIAVPSEQLSFHLMSGGVDYLVEEKARDIEHQPTELPADLKRLQEEVEAWLTAHDQAASAAEHQLGSQRPLVNVQLESGNEEEQQDRSPVSSAGSSDITRSGGSGDTTLIHADHFNLESEEYGIECRGGRITVMDETNPKWADVNLPPLILQVYDFLRPCPQHPAEFLADLEIPLQLDGLREKIRSTLSVMRGEIRDAQAKKAEARKRVGETEPAREAKRPAIDDLGRPVKMSGAEVAAYMRAKKTKGQR